MGGFRFSVRIEVKDMGYRSFGVVVLSEVGFFPLHDGVQELIGQNVIREVGNVPPLPL